jgi:hypothetical protein
MPSCAAAPVKGADWPKTILASDWAWAVRKPATTAAVENTEKVLRLTMLEKFFREKSTVS